MLSISLIVLGCNEYAFDDRKKFVGDYVFTIHEKGYDAVLEVAVDTMYDVVGKIDYGNIETRISIYYLEFIIAEPTLYKDCSIIGDGIEGVFSTHDHLSFHYTNSGLGNGVSSSITGEKTK